MDSAAIVNSYFTPLHYVLYLGVIIVLVAVWEMMKWQKYTAKYIKIIVVNNDGSTSVYYQEKENGYVALKNPKTGASRLWPVTDLACFDQLYPGDVIIPKFMQKPIKTTLLDGTDWEPMVNRGPSLTGVASPDVKAQFEKIAEFIQDEKTKAAILEYVGGLKTTGTKRMIASPSLLGNLMMEKITEAVMSVNKEMMDKFDMILKRIIKPANPMVVYIGLGLIILLLIYNIYTQSQGSGTEMLDGINAIKRSLGVP